MEIFKISGCPNCKTENMDQVLSISEFKKYKKLQFINKFGNSTFLYECSECKTKYMRINDGHLLHKLTGHSLQRFNNFFDSENKLKDKHNNILNKIGSPIIPGGSREYPARVKTMDGTIYENAVILLSSSIWPISIDVEKTKFYKEIIDIEPSDESLTLEQRIAAYNAPEIRMGASPIWLKRKDQVYMINYYEYFIPQKYGNPDEFEIVEPLNIPMQKFDPTKKVFFLGWINE